MPKKTRREWIEDVLTERGEPMKARELRAELIALGAPEKMIEHLPAMLRSLCEQGVLQATPTPYGKTVRHIYSLAPKGTAPPPSKTIPDDTVREMRRLREKGKSIRSIARDLGTNESTTGAIIRGDIRADVV